MNEPPTCKKCGSEMSIPDGYDDTGFCNECAQTIALAAEAFVVAHDEDFEDMKASDSMDVDLDFLALCEAVLPEKELYQDPNQPEETKP